MFEKYRERARRSLFFARYEASKLGSRVIESEHILLGILREGEETVSEIFRRFQVKPEDIRREIEGERVFGERIASTSELPLSEESKKIIAYASHEAESMRHASVGSEHLLIGLLRVEGCTAMRILAQYGFDVYTVREEVLAIAKEREAAQRRKELPFLTEYGRDLTDLAAEQAFEPLIGRDEDVDRIIQIFLRRTKNNPILLGEPGVGTAAIVEGLAKRIIEGRVPIFLANKRIVALDLSLLVAGTNRGQSEERLKGILKELKENIELIVFIDEIHSLIDAGLAEGSLDAANLLKPALSRGEISCIGATTLKEYRRYIEKDRSLLQHFEPIQIAPPTDEETLELLRRMKADYERFHAVRYSDAALRAAVSQASRYITDRPQLRKAIDVIDEAGVLVKLRRVRDTQNLQRLEQEIRQVVKELKVAITDKDFERAVDRREREIELREDLERMSIAADENGVLQVTERDIEDAIAAIKGRLAAPEQMPPQVPLLTNLQNILIFLSYAREDYEHAVTLYEQLTNRGLQVWMDKKDLLGGMKWQPELRRMIKKADLILICLSKNAVKKRGFIQAEMKTAFEIAKERPADDIYIIPLRLEAGLEDDEIPPDLSEYQYIDMFEEKAIDRVLASIDYQLKRRAGKPNPKPEK
jgi:ATP-dependent Clp protease ATP-binding subunit ClpC